MQLLAPALLLTAVVAARGASLRGDFERDVANPSGRRLDHHCVDNASYLGCFDDQNNKRAMPYQVRGQGHSARECMRACDKKGYSTFARQWKGQCFCGDGDDHERHGKERGCDCCDDNVGGGKMCVWRIGDEPPGCPDGGPNADYLGCYNDRNQNRVLSKKLGGWDYSAEDCQRECEKRDYKYFGREWRGQCFCGDSDRYHKHRAAKDCDCCKKNVGSRKICVWRT